uniref:nuclear receptor corepressor 2 isoform X2 n=1 Tax=Ciona intestinalis TaxID=7719 RepID=UPI000EF53058|nr:nuclear receptor corepressor 2 isoform X2 [Ciona intestinalis]|eukprot:XP_026692214.1 nuclear receptor corepressor 2 isoform X2 [Ciona intestinalis]
MKPPWQSQHHVATSGNNPHHPTSRIETSQAPTSSVSDPSLVLSQLFAHQQNALHSSYLSMYTKPDQKLPYDPRMQLPVMSASLPRSQMLGVPTPHQPLPSTNPYQQRRSAPLRVSLLRDIDIAGERDKDTPASSGASYAYSGSALHPSQIASSSRHTQERPITMLGNMQHNYQQQQQACAVLSKQQDIPSFNHPSFGAQQHPAYSGLPITKEIKQEAIVVKLEEQDKGMYHPPSDNTSDHTASQTPSVQRHAGVPTQPKQDITNPASVSYEQKSKEDLVQAMDKVDREIAKVESEINRIQKKKTQLEESAKMPPEPEKSASSPQRVEPKHRDLWQVIYAENRKKAEAARVVLDGLCPRYDMPLYNQPCDTKVYQQNLKKNEEMRPKLLKFFKHRSKLQNIRERYICARYDQLMQQWNNKAERIENNVKKKAKDAKTREYFEKLFPEIRKQREQQERVDRVGTRGDSCRSDADFAQIVDGLSEQENQLNHMRQLAVVPPMLLDRDEQRVRFISTNGFIREPFKDFKESQQLDSWAEQEKIIFKEKFVLHPKNFNLIASFIEKKSVADCILYYYLTKKTNNYKALVRKQSMKPKKPKSGRSHASSNNDQTGTGKDSSEKTDETKKEEEITEIKVDRPPSPRMTRARKQTMNWTEEEISLVKEGFGKHGKDFCSISRMVTNKSEQQVKNFYHNYKKKHGLDQLITESRKKKTNESRRTRYHAPSPDTLTTPSPDVTSSTDAKPKQEKPEEEKPFIEEEKKLADSPPSTTASTTKTVTKPETTEAATLSTSHIRTRRITAALAAAATPEESQSAKRAVSGDSPVSTSGEPAEKKQKTKPRVEQTVDQTKKLESGDGKTTDSVDKSTPVEGAAPPASKSKPVNPKSEKLEIKKKDVEGKKAEPDCDSSATCSADEDNSEIPSTATTSVPTSVKYSSSPYAFDDDVNDSPTHIRLEAARHSLSASSASINPPNIIQSSSAAAAHTVDSGVLNLANKRSRAPPVSSTIDPRPQSLPPASMIPSSYLPHLISSESLKKTMLIPELNSSRPSSTPGFTLAHDRTMPTAQPKVTERPAAVSAKTAPSYLSTGQHIESIHNLKYVGKQSSSTPPRPASRPLSSTSGIEEKRKPSSVTHPGVAQPYHIVPSSATSLDKDFTPAVVPSPMTVPMPGFYHYTDRDLQSMKDRSADIPDPIPVSSLRFNSKTSQPYIPPASTAVIQLLATKPSDIKSNQEVAKQMGMVTSHQPTHQPPLPTTSISSASPSRASVASTVYRPHIPHERPTGISMSPYKPSSPDRPSSSHLGSITQGKPVFRAPTSQPYPEEPNRTLDLNKPSQSIPLNINRRTSSEVGSPPIKRSTIPPSPWEFIPTSLGASVYGGFPFPPSAISSKPLTSSKVMPGDKNVFQPGVLRPEHYAMFEGVAPNYPLGLGIGSIVNGTPIKRKPSDDASVSPRNVVTPPQPKVAERKVSQIYQQKSETPPHVAPHTVQPAYSKDEMRKPPSSGLRETPDRKSYTVAVSPNMTSHHRSQTIQQKPPSFPTVTHAFTDHFPHTVAPDPRLLSASLPHLPSYNFAPGLPRKEINSVMQEYLRNFRNNPLNPLTAAFPLLRPFTPPSLTESFENSRHNVLAQDFHTAQLMQQQHEAARRSPFSSITVPSSVPLPTHPVLVSGQNFNALAQPRHVGSPNPLQFLPQHPIHPLASQSSPANLSHASSTKSPTSPLRNPPQMKLRYQIPSPLPPFYDPHPQSPKSRGEESRSISSDSRHPHEPRNLSPAHYPTPKEIPPRGYEPSDQVSKPVAPRGSSSPHQFHHPLSKPIKMEQMPDSEFQSQSHPSNLQRTGNPTYGHTQKKPPTTTESQLHGYDLTQRRSSEPRESRSIEVEKHPDLRGCPDPYVLALQEQEKMAKELKVKGRATMTPEYLINAIIDQSIKKFGESAEKMTKESTSSSITATTSQVNPKSEADAAHRAMYEARSVMKTERSSTPRHPSYDHQSPDATPSHQPTATHPKPWQGSKCMEKVDHEDGVSYLPTNRGGREERNSPSVTKTLHEHSQDVISDIYRKSEAQPSSERLGSAGHSHKPEFLQTQAPGFMSKPVPTNEATKRKQKTPISGFGGIQQPGTRMGNVQLQHPFVPSVFASNPQNPDISFELLIRKALIEHGQSSSQTPPPPHMSIPSSPAAQRTGLDSPTVQVPSSQNPAKPTDHVSPLPTEMISSPMFISALSVRAGQNSTVPQVPQQPSNMSGRGSNITGTSGHTAATPVRTGNSSAYQSPVERVPPLVTQYEPLSDSD